MEAVLVDMVRRVVTPRATRAGTAWQGYTDTARQAEDIIAL